MTRAAAARSRRHEAPRRPRAARGRRRRVRRPARGPVRRQPHRLGAGREARDARLGRERALQRRQGARDLQRAGARGPRDRDGPRDREAVGHPEGEGGDLRLQGAVGVGDRQVRRPQHEPDRPAAHRASRARSRAQRVRPGALGAAGVGAQRLGERDRVLDAEPERLAQRIGEVALRARADLVAHPQHVAAGTGAVDLDLLTTLCCRGTRVVGAGHPPNHLRFAARANSDMR